MPKAKVRGTTRVSKNGKAHYVKPHQRRYEGGTVRDLIGGKLTPARAAAAFSTASAATWTYTAVMSLVAAIMCGIATACLALLGYNTGVKRARASKASGRKSTMRLRTEMGWYRAKKKAATGKARIKKRLKKIPWRKRFNPVWRLKRYTRGKVTLFQAKVRKKFFPTHHATFKRKPGNRIHIQHRRY